MSIGQFSRSSVIKVWRCIPVFKGIGFSMVLLAVLTNLHYNIYMAYGLVYSTISFFSLMRPSTELPWISCGEYSVDGHENFQMPTSLLRQDMG